MNVVKFDARKKICENNFRKHEVIEQLYLDIASMVLIKLYKAFPFHSLFEGFGEIDNPNDFFQSTLITWADCFMEWRCSNTEQAIKAADYLIEKNIIPSAGLFRAAYRGDRELIKIAQYESYIAYLFTKSQYDPDHRRIINNALSFDDWVWENKKAEI